MADNEFLAEAARAKFEITPVAGDKLATLVGDIYKFPPAIAEGMLLFRTRAKLIAVGNK